MQGKLLFLLLVVGFAAALKRNRTNGNCSKREVWVPCSSPCIPERTCQNQFPKPTSEVCIELCVGKCECDFDNGYIKNNANGKCVRFKQCPTHCTKEEVLNTCASSCLPEPSCQTPKPKQTSISCTTQCMRRCECDAKAGLIRDEVSGQCIPKGKCPAHCTKEEVLNTCASSCLPEPSCQTPKPKQTSISCTTQCMRRCECDAKAGLIRDEVSGQCIPKGKCPAHCTKEEVLNTCASSCLPEPSCQTPKPKQTSISCTTQCMRRCECDAKAGLIRDEVSGQCIPKGKCPATCAKNEALNECASSCLPEPSCQIPKPKQNSSACTLQCVRRCECDANAGFIRDEISGQCVPKGKCPATCAKNEALNECASSCLPEPSCQIPKPKQNSSACTLQCVRRCECDANAGFIRDEISGQCVPKGKCPATCAKNEALNECASSCLPEPSCQIPKPKQNSSACTLQCVRRCECDANAGFIRDEISGQCVPKGKCPATCAKNEALNECASSCLPEPSCQIPKPKQNSSACTLQCVRRCECDANAGFIRDEISGQCVPEGKCPATCAKNEALNECASSCLPEPSCQIPKPKQNSSACTLQCVRRCECDANAGFIRDEISGQCVPKGKCPATCAKNEALNECASSCLPEPSCQIPKPKQNSSACTLQCVRRCECDANAGFIRDEISGQCVPEGKCPATCAKNEALNECASSCLPEPSCQIPKPKQNSSACTLQCVRRCECDANAGFIRDEISGQCVPKGKCPATCAKNEALNECASSCLPEPSCQIPKPKQNSSACTLQCVRRCECDANAGFIRDEISGQCVPKGKCPATCAKNEALNECASSCLPEPSCQIPKPKQNSSACTLQCVQRCECDANAGFIRDEISGQCVPKGKCPATCAKNEALNECASSCLPEPSCQIPKPKQNSSACTLQCVRRCECDANAGFIRDEISGQCVPKGKCPATCAKNEALNECASSCLPEPSCQIPKPKQNSSACTLQCVRRCECDANAGFIRDEISGQCVPKGKCPATCAKNEALNECASSCLPEPSCQIPKPKQNSSACTLQCVRRCECDANAGFIRDEISGQCVPKGKCPATCAKNEALNECASSCLPEPSCQIPKPKQNSSACTLQCVRRCECDANAGFIRDEISGQCVPKGKCPATCAKNEALNECASSCLPEPSCQIPKPKQNSSACTLQCVRRCECDANAGFIRDEISGQCVPKGKCPATCAKNEALNECASSCLPEPSCQIPKPKQNSSACTLQCVRRCECDANAGFIRDEISGQCVPKGKCPATCAKNEALNECASSCLPEPSCQIPKPKQNSSACTLQCVRRCECDANAGFIRDEISGQCVPKGKCPATCAKNEALNECASSCLPEPSCQIPKPKQNSSACTLQCVRRCECDANAGFIRDEISGQCVPKGKCPATCAKNEALNECASSCLPEPSCQIPKPKQNSSACTLQCVRRCECDANAGFIRDEISGQCVPKGKCPATCAKNEALNECASSCLPEPSCQIPKPKQNSSACTLQCVRRCECDANAGFIRDEISGQCVPKGKCPATCAKNEALNECASSCLPEPSCQIPKPKQNSSACTLQCVRRCECDANAGFIRDEISGQCVPKGKCPATCAKNEALNECASSCLPEPSCQIPKPKQNSSACTLQCVRRCECDANAGFIRDEISGQCVPKGKCPATCTKDELLCECASSCLPEPTCQTPKPKQNSSACTSHCVRRCECNSIAGLIRDEISGQCVPKGKCPATCGLNETLNSCASPCVAEQSCHYRNPDCTGIPCQKNCVQRCECNKGYIRDPQTGKCVITCPVECGANQYLGCQPCCQEATCYDPKPEPCKKICPLICILECLCEKGYVRDVGTGACVLEKNCPKQ